MHNASLTRFVLSAFCLYSLPILPVIAWIRPFPLETLVDVRKSLQDFANRRISVRDVYYNCVRNAKFNLHNEWDGHVEV